MKVFIVTINIWFITLLNAGAQPTTAMDWIKNDCRHNQPFTLFSQLDSGYVVISEYVMLACPPCNEAAEGLKKLMQPFETSHPGRVKLFQTAHDDVTTCSGLVHWGDTSGYTYPLFDNGLTEKQYYSNLVGMPIIVVLGGGTAHKIYYTELGYSPATDSMAVTHAINMALLPAGISSVNNAISFFVSPNPVLKDITINYDKLITDCTITSLTGQVVYKNTYASGQLNPVINVPDITPGIYFLKITDVDGNVGVQKVVKE